MQLQTIGLKESPSSLTYRINESFIAHHRPDLGVEGRIKIGLIAVYGNKYGRITRLSNRHGLSRTTIYDYAARVKKGLFDAFNAPITSEVSKIALLSLRESAIRQLLVLRLAGRCSVSATSAVLKCSDYVCDSVGFVSQILTAIGDELPQVVDYQGTCAFACDEIFYSGTEQILITVEPLSCAILQIEIATQGPKAAWIEHWGRLYTAGTKCSDLLTDEGHPLEAARLAFFAQLEAAERCQSDTFHAISLRLGVFYRRLEKAAFLAIGAEYAREKLCHKDQTSFKLAKFEQERVEKQQKSQNAIATYDAFSFLYRHLLQQLNPFDRNGLPRSRSKAQAEALCALELMQQLDIQGLNKEVESILKILPNLFRFLDKTQEVYQKIITDTLIPPEYLPFWAKAWQYTKRAWKVKNNYQYQKKLRKKAQEWLDWIQKETKMNQQQFQILKNIIFTRFEGILQSSAAVEMVNSIIRPFLNQSKDQISQQTLNLIIDYYNNRPFLRGKRKGMSPLEILSGEKKQTDWFDKIIEIVRRKKI